MNGYTLNVKTMDLLRVVSLSASSVEANGNFADKVAFDRLRDALLESGITSDEIDEVIDDRSAIMKLLQ